MLGSGDFNRIKGSFDFMIETLGIPVTWNKIQAPTDTQSFQCGGRNLGKEDTEYINTYGSGARIFVAKAESFPSGLPMEFDTIEVPNGDVYILAAVHEVWINGELVGYRMVGRSNR